MALSPISSSHSSSLPQGRTAPSKPARNHVGEKLQPLQAAADHHEAPAVILRHVIEREAGERRQRQQQAIERLARIAPRAPRRAGSRAAGR